MKRHHKSRKRRKRARAAAITHNEAEIRALQDCWTALTAQERASRLTALLAKGCTRRGLAPELGISESSIRWYSNAAALPPSSWQAIEGGASVTSALKERSVERAAALQAAFVSSAEQRAKSVRAFTEWLLGFLARRGGLGPGYTESFFGELRTRVRTTVVTGVPPVDSARAAQKVIGLCRPEKSDYEFEFAWLLEWTLRVVLSLIPPAIVDDVLDEAERAARKGIPRLRIKKTTS